MKRMKISINLNKTLKDNVKDSRTSLYVWKNLKHLTEFYSDVVDDQTINNIADKIRTGKIKINNKAYTKREGLGDTLNESCLCNLVEMELLNREEVLEKFLDKPISF